MPTKKKTTPKKKTSAKAKATPKRAKSSSAAEVAPESSIPKVIKYQRPTKILHRSELKEAPYNPRYIDPAAKRKLRKSIEKFGLVQHPVWNKRTGNIVAGHQRLQELDKLHGSPDYHLEVVVVDVDEVTEREENIALNNPASQGMFDAEKLYEVIHATPDLDVHNTGFEVVDLEMIYADHGLPTEMLDKLYSPAALETIRQTTEATQELIDEADAIRLEKEDRKNLAGQNGHSDSDDDECDDDSESQETDPEMLALIKQRRQAYNERVALENEAHFHVTLVFRTDNEKESFLKALELDPYKTMIDGPSLAEYLDIELPELPSSDDSNNSKSSEDEEGNSELTREASENEESDAIPF